MCIKMEEQSPLLSTIDAFQSREKRESRYWDQTSVQLWFYVAALRRLINLPLPCFFRKLAMSDCVHLTKSSRIQMKCLKSKQPCGYSEKAVGIIFIVIFIIPASPCHCAAIHSLSYPSPKQGKPPPTLSFEK